jgi:hypothetical protein
MFLAVAVCLGSLAVRSRALRSTPVPSAAPPRAGSDLVVLAAVDGHLRAKLHRLAQR